MSIPAVVRNSTLYSVLATLFRWFRASKTETILSNPLVLQGLLGVTVVLSIGSVLTSDLGAATKFLSFALLFVVLTFITWGFAEPLSEN